MLRCGLWKTLILRLSVCVLFAALAGCASQPGIPPSPPRITQTPQQGGADAGAVEKDPVPFLEQTLARTEKLDEGRVVWIGSAAFDIGVELSRTTGQITHHISPDVDVERDLLIADLTKVDRQINLIQSLIYNLPFVVGVNVFFMGLPGTGSAESKAWMNCYFLAGTVILFIGSYYVNQQTVRKELLPLRRELEAVSRAS